MDWTHVQEIADKKVLYLRRSGAGRVFRARSKFGLSSTATVFIFSPTQVKPPRGSRTSGAAPRVTVRIGEQHFGAVARVLDRDTDRELWDQAAALAERNYGWGDGLLVEISPFPPRTTDPDPPIEPTERG